MSKYPLLLIVAFLLLAQTQAQVKLGCINPRGEVVDWFAIITTPEKLHKKHPQIGFLYFDSKMKNNSFTVYSGYGNEENMPIGKTIDQVNKYNLQNMVWNDQFPGKTSSVKAHAKGYIALSPDGSAGFMMDHSTPHYPTINLNRMFANISKQQQKCAQHHFCLTIDSRQMAQSLIDHTCFTNPNIYFNSIFGLKCQDDDTQDRFRYINAVLKSGHALKSVAKNGYSRPTAYSRKGEPYESDIFNEGISPMLDSSIIAQTYGAPSPDQIYCEGSYNVGNSLMIRVRDYIWEQGSDHCKWAYALDNNFVCFGDLNRNTERQRLRGGAFYCIDSPNLNKAMRQINPRPEAC